MSMSTTFVKKLIAYYFFSLFIFLPLIFLPGAAIPFEIPKVWIFNRYVELFAAMFLLHLFVQKKSQKINVLFLTFILLFLTIAMITSVTGRDFSKSFWGNFFRGDGLFTLLHLLSYSIIIANIWTEKLYIPTARAISTGSFIASLISVGCGILLFFFRFNIPNWEGAIGTVFGNPNFLAGYLSVTLPFSFIILKQARKKVIVFILILVQYTAIFLTLSWFGYLIAVMAIMGWVVVEKKVSVKKPAVMIAFVSILLLVIVIAGGQYLKIRKHYRGFLPEGRERIYTKAFLAIKKQPFLGWGWANFDYAFDEIVWPSKYLHDVYVDKPHSQGLEILISTGIVGFLAYLLIIFRSFNFLFSIKHPVAPFFVLSLILYLIHSQTNIISVNEELIFWLLAGIAGSKT